MFSGIIESLGIVTDLRDEGSNRHITIQSSLSHEVYIDQSIAHNGVCLTVVAIKDDTYTVTAIDETLRKSNLGQLQVGQSVNLERALTAGQRLDGHFVQGHVDTTATCIGIEPQDGSWIFRFKTSQEFDNLLVEKGSICINGISLTLIDAAWDHFSIGVIPYTFEHTNLSKLKIQETVNLEFDILGKYIHKYLQNLKLTK
ncbi:MAG: riboflavin synthase [Chitinophagales bacterium]|nr:riboflavin synthase [Chitinophagales bacterium]